MRPLAVALSRQRWIPYRLRRSALKRIAPSMLKSYDFTCDFYGLTFRGNIVNYIDRLIYFCGGHEKFMLHFLRDFVSALRAKEPQRSLTFLDVGANAGNHTMFMSRLVNQVHAFEPFERVRRQLEDHVKLNNLSNVIIHPFGLGNEEAVLPFYAGPDSNLGAASFVQDPTDYNVYLGELSIKRGDDIVKAQDISGVTIMKADVEGFEPFVLKGLSQTLAKDRPLMVIEISPKTREILGSSEAFHQIFPPDYRFYYFAKGKIDSGAYRLAPYDYSLTPHLQDVIACPAEWDAFLPRHG